MKYQKRAIIIGAGPAGLTAAFELLKRTDVHPVIYEQSEYSGGISRTVNHRGNRIDIGGHRFFSRSQRVLSWWEDVLPLQGAPSRDDILLERNLPLSNSPGAPDPEKEDRVMLVRNRLSRILFMNRFFSYPVSANWDTCRQLGLLRIVKILFSYFHISFFPIKNEVSLEDFLINRFGRELYHTFFKDYTEKVWGVPCDRIQPEWGAQRIKGLSIARAVAHAIKSLGIKDGSLQQRDVETSLIGRFLYPKYGPGQLWEEVAGRVEALGGEIFYNHEVVRLVMKGHHMTDVLIRDCNSGKLKKEKCDFVFSSMPVKDLVASIGDNVPVHVKEVAALLKYRDFITVGVLLNKLTIENQSKNMSINNIIPDNWIYIQEKDVKLGRIQIFNNWSPYMVEDNSKVWLGLEYFSNEGDIFWRKSDEELSSFAIMELGKLGFCKEEDVLDSVVIRTPKAYPAYLWPYENFHIIRDFTDKIENLFLIGRNGMHRYNNQDHSMLTAMTAVDNIQNGIVDKDNIWAVNTEEIYHESG